MIQTVFSIWNGEMEPQLSIYWTVAIAATVIFIIQMILTLVGIDSTDSGDGDVTGFDAGHGDTLDTGGAIQLFTLRNVVNFFLGLGWGGVCFYSVVPDTFLLALVALLCGCAMVGAFMLMFRQLMKLQSDGSFRIEESVGQVCDVYLRIPARRRGMGRVQVSFHGSVQELPALTEGEEIPSGAKVKILGLIGENTLLVEPV